jgi:hypothetical protein
MIGAVRMGARAEIDKRLVDIIISTLREHFCVSAVCTVATVAQISELLEVIDERA